MSSEHGPAWQYRSVNSVLASARFRFGSRQTELGWLRISSLSLSLSLSLANTTSSRLVDLHLASAPRNLVQFRMSARKEKLRACLRCQFVQSPRDFHLKGCPNCEPVLEVRFLHRALLHDLRWNAKSRLLTLV